MFIRKTLKHIVGAAFCALQITITTADAVLDERAIKSWCDTIESEKGRFSYYALRSAYMIDNTVCTTATDEIRNRMLTDANTSFVDGLCRMYIETRDTLNDSPDSKLREIFNVLMILINADPVCRQLLEFRIKTMSFFEDRLSGMCSLIQSDALRDFETQAETKIKSMIDNGRVGVHVAFIFDKQNWLMSNAKYFGMEKCNLSRWNIR